MAYKADKIDVAIYDRRFSYYYDLQQKKYSFQGILSQITKTQKKVRKNKIFQ